MNHDSFNLKGLLFVLYSSFRIHSHSHLHRIGLGYNVLGLAQLQTTTSCSQCPSVNEERQQLNWFSWPPQGYMPCPVPLHISLCLFWGFWGFWGFVVICQQIPQTPLKSSVSSFYSKKLDNSDHFCFYKKFTFLLHCVLQKSINIFVWKRVPPSKIFCLYQSINQ